MKPRVPQLRDYVVWTAIADDGEILEVYGQVVAVSKILDSDDKVQHQNMVKRPNGTTVNVGTPLWKLKEVVRG